MNGCVYVHYNLDGPRYPNKYDYAVFSPVKNAVPPNNKPRPGTGLWASPLVGTNNWANWCKENAPQWVYDRPSFCFTVVGEANVVFLRNADDLSIAEYYGWPDFEQMTDAGVDAIEVEIRNLAQILVGWDCDSLLVMNPQIVVPV